ncbi:MAG: type II toxin-antitoxin system PemK/MazF family toxin [Candidatus Omnitrophota bacterium]
MEKLVRGDVVVLPFPFSDLTQSKKRPALVVAGLQGEDIILCQITSRKIKDKYSVIINDNDFEIGVLNQISNVRSNRIFTADRRLILYRIGHLKAMKSEEVINRIISILHS